ncbi:MAG: hypothetical protein FWH21_00925 [Kiritimatiellaeota bacterium]|nr:hypothetical protein [Kiritimatiellota bacterium]
MTPLPEYDPALFEKAMRGVNPATSFYAFDFEVYNRFVLCCFINLRTGDFTYQVAANRIGEELSDLVAVGSVLIGWNSWGFDRYLASACMEGAGDKDVRILANALVDGIVPEDCKHLRLHKGEPFDRRKAWCNHRLRALVADIGLDMDRKTIGGGEIVPAISLKEWERRNGIPVCTSPVDFKKTDLTEDEKNQIIHYCRYDVTATALAVVTDPQGNIPSKALLIEENNADPLAPRMDWSMTDQKLGSIWLRAEKRDPGDWERQKPTVPHLCMPKNPDVVAFFNQPCGNLFEDVVKDGRMKKEGVKLTTEICGLKHILGIGGIHSAERMFVEGDIWNVDAASLYPYIMAVYNLVSRAVPDPDMLWSLIAQRIVFKREKNPKEKSRKKVLVSTYGAMGGAFADLYSPREAISVCVVGQMLFVHLLERLEPYINLVQSNTDGIMFTLKSPSYEERVRTLLSAFEYRSGLIMEIDKYVAAYQHNVNNYVAVTASGKMKCAGAMFKQNHASVQPVDVLVNIANALRRKVDLSGLPLERFARTFKCDKNHVGFVVNGVRMDVREIQCVAVPPRLAQRITALRKDGQHTKVTNLWTYSRLMDDTARDDVDESAYGSIDLKPTGQTELF